MPLGVDIVEPPMMFALQQEGLEVGDGQQVMLDAREVKSQDEITLLNIACAMVDGVYHDIAEALKPGVKESQIVAMATKRLYELGSDCVEAINAISGERCSPHPHNFTDRIIRPGDQAYFDIIQSFTGYRTCYYRTFSVGRATAPQIDAYKQAREWMDTAIAMLKPGISSDQVATALPEAQDIGFESEMAAFGLNFCHGLGLGLHERPLMQRPPYGYSHAPPYGSAVFPERTGGNSDRPACVVHLNAANTARRRSLASTCWQSADRCRVEYSINQWCPVAPEGPGKEGLYSSQPENLAWHCDARPA